MSAVIVLLAAPEDIDTARRIQNSLESAGFTVRGDIQDARCCVVILSPEANHSPLVEQQLAHVREHNLRIFPVIARGDEWSAIPKAFIGMQMIDVRANYDARMARLVEIVNEYLKK